MNTENTSEWGSRRHLHVLELMTATVLGIYLCYRMALPFVPALTWALALAVLFMPVHRWLESTVKHSNLTASVSVLLIGLIVVVHPRVAPIAQWIERQIDLPGTIITIAAGLTVVWIPAALFLALDGSWGKTLILAVWGGVLVAGSTTCCIPF